jgi:hypothetical protein
MKMRSPHLFLVSCHKRNKMKVKNIYKKEIPY